ncbi:MAG: zinc transporter ZupT [Thermodesulfobacteriota bacterium]
MESSAVALAFGLTLLAGLCTGIGSLLAFWAQKPSPKFLALVLGLSAGVMLYVSFVELFAEAKSGLVQEWGQKSGSWAVSAAFFLGIGLIALIDRLVPEYENPHEIHNIQDLGQPGQAAEYQRLYHTGLVTALAIAIHNFPEGLATFTASLQDPGLGIPIATAIALHNIPEGIAVFVPLYYASGSRKMAFLYSFGSGLAEPAGAAIGFVLLYPFLSQAVFSSLLAAVGGIMVFVALDELLPSAEEYKEHHLAIFGLICGMALMAVSLLMFA